MAGLSARSHADAPEIDGSVHVTGAARVGEFARVLITGASEYDLTGETSRGASVGDCLRLGSFVFPQYR